MSKPLALIDPLEPEERFELIDPLLPVEANAETATTTPSPEQKPLLDLTPFLTQKGITWEAPPIDISPVEMQPQASMPFAQTSDQTPPTLVPAPLKKAPTPYSVAQELGTRLLLAFRAGVAYMYAPESSIYLQLTRDDVLGLVYRYARFAIEMDGRPSYAEAVVKHLYGEDCFRIKGFCRTGVVAMKNKLLTFSPFSVSQPTPQVLVSIGVNANWAPGAACPLFERFLEIACCGDEVLVARIWQILGYILARDTSAKRIFVLSGPTNSGKSLFVNLLSALFYPQGRAVVTRSVKELSKRFRRTALEDAALCLVPDMPNEPIAEPVVGVLKSLSGGDVIDDDVKYREGVQFTFQGNLLLTTNHELVLAEDDPALQSRFLRLPFLHSVPLSEQDRDLLPKLKCEVDAIATRALLSYRVLRDNGYVFEGDYEHDCPVVGTSKTGSVFEWSVAEFVQKHFVRQDGGVIFVEDAWKMWMAETGHSLALARFSALLFLSFPELAKAGVHAKKHRPGGKNAISAIIGYTLS